MPPWFRIDPGRIWSSAIDATSYLLSYDIGEPTRSWPSGGPSWETTIHPLRGIGPRDEAEYQRVEARQVRQQEAVSALTDIYRWGVRIAVIPALLGLAAAIVTRAGRRHPAATLLCTAMLTAVAARIALLAVTDGLSFPAATNPVYQLSGVSFLLAFLVLGCWSLASVLRASLSTHGQRPVTRH